MNVPRERMLAYLYDELSSQERTAFETELSGSEVARRELAELETVQAPDRALGERDGTHVTWLEKVSDEQYDAKVG